MKHGIYKILFMGKELFEVYVWIGNRKMGYIETFSYEKDAIKCFNETTYQNDKIGV